jgi:hypothetical protein
MGTLVPLRLSRNAVHWNDPFRGLMLTFCFAIGTADLSRLCPLSVVAVPTFNGRRHPGVIVSSRERTALIVFRCVSVIRRDVRRIRIGLIGRRRNTLCYGRPAAELPRNGADVSNLQQSEIIQPTGCNGRCLPLVSWGCGLRCAYSAQ